LTYGLDRGLGLAAHSVLVVDEAGMVGTRALARLAEAAAAPNAKLVLVGDDRQLPEIQAGGAFKALAERVGAVELREVRRQRHAWDRSALAALRAGDVERFVGEYEHHGRIVAAATPADARTAMVADWWRAHLRGDHVLMIAHRRRDVAELNAGTREVLRAAGRLGNDELVTPQRVFAIGDRVIAERNDSRLGVVNGQRRHADRDRRRSAGRRVRRPIADRAAAQLRRARQPRPRLRDHRTPRAGHHG